MRRLTCWWKGHEYVVVHHFLRPLNIQVVCLRCMAGTRDEGTLSVDLPGTGLLP